MILQLFQEKWGILHEISFSSYGYGSFPLRDARHFSPFDSMGAHAGAIALSSSRQHEPSDSRQDEHLPGARRLRVELSA
jgi:hypothetical protein